MAALAVLCFLVLSGRKNHSPGHVAQEPLTPIAPILVEEPAVAPATNEDHSTHDNFAAKYKHFLKQFNAAANKDITSAYWVSSLSEEDLREMAQLWINGEFGKIPSPLMEMAFKELGRRLGSEIVSLLETSREIDTLDRESLRAFAEGFSSTDVDKASLMARTTLNQTLRYRIADGVTAWALTLPMEEGIRYVEGIQDLVQTPAAFASGVASVWLAADTAQEAFGKLTRLASGNFDPIIIGGFHGTGVTAQIYKDPLAAIKEMKTYAWPSQDIESRVWMGAAAATSTSAQAALRDELIERYSSGNGAAAAALESLARKMAKRDPNEMAQLLTENTYPPEVADRLTSGLVRAIWTEDREAAEQWLNTIKDEKKRDSVRARMR